MKKIKLNNYQLLGVILMPFIILIIVFGIITYKSGISIINANTDKKNDSTFSYCTGLNYHIDANATSLQKECFTELNEAIKENDEVKIATAVAKNFVVDFFNWTDKQDTYDVGGMYYVYTSKRNNVYDRARSTFYKYLSTYIDEYGSDELLEVKDIKVESADKVEDYEFNSKVYESYYVRLRWGYVDHKFDTDGFLDVGNVQIIKNENGRFEIVEFYGDN